MFRFRIEVDRVLNDLQNTTRRINKRELALLREVGQSYVKKARQIIKNHNYVDKGKLINSIFYNVSGVGDTFTLNVWSKMPYSRYIDEGTERHYVSFYGQRGARRHLLVSWALRHDVVEMRGNALYNKSTGRPTRGLYVGLRATGFMSDTFEEEKSAFVERHNRILRE